ncbi:Putative Zinc finger, CCCH-type, Zinc finger, RING-type, Zinc finger, RING/FYVE/PHD-type [Septoria linicola]|uniref:Pre-mRNA-splicing factor CWC24 n=1 Tax=Septoria linicola TaxID=215465 RepID=A0A9Q9EK15_9PEZI|nr:putative Zinc finger, CCCH-type, Zinc finger, RING-type, Zinc finger, RING/FYVE/PHD-type [Septoria linicola]USW52772.1 Putative Zinc finger, CCCH-type, Zinc finger, RING-type, Zinc finger, RING/FYVE/PHD-type [Septoria linicola]
MADTAAPVFKKRAKNSNVRKRPATPPPDNSDSESDYTDDEQGTRIKRRKTDGVNLAGAGPKREVVTSKYTAFQADRSTNISSNNDATKASNWYTDAALAAKDGKTKPDTETVVPEATDGTYQGTAKYSTFIQKNPEKKQLGPQKAPTNVRTITVTDFAPDVCKDYKQTGFCGFGDSCKFLHAREDYKQGWQLDREWEKAGKKDKKPNNDDSTADMDDEEKLLSSIPFACIICKSDYKNPVVTKCGHYFCEKCAMTRYMKDKKKQCANCGADTQGSFGVARKLKELLERKRVREEERAEREAQKGQE